MRKSNFISGLLAVVMIIPMIMSCSSGDEGENVVKKSDPWYESTRFKLERDVHENEVVNSMSAICSSDDKVFSLYAVTDSMFSYTRPTLDIYNFNGKLDKRKEISCPDNTKIYDIFSLSVDPKGKTLTAAVQLNSQGRFGPAFIDIDAKSGEISNIVDIFSPEAMMAMDGGGENIYSVSYIEDYEVVLLVGGESRVEWDIFLYKDKEFVLAFDTSTLDVGSWYDGFSIDTVNNSLYASGFSRGESISYEFDLNTGKLKDQKSLMVAGDDSDNPGEYTATDKGELFKIDSLGNISKFDMSTMTSQVMIDTNWYTPYFQSITDEWNGSYSRVLSCNEDRAVLWDVETASYGYFTSSNRYEYITVLKKARKNPHAGKQIIELALPPKSEVSPYLAKTIVEFNNTDKDYHIRVWDKSKSGFTMGKMLSAIEDNDAEIYEMIQELQGNSAPDIVLGIQKNYAMRDDIFMDLTGFLDQEVMDKQYGNILEAGKLDNKLYFLPVTLEIEGLVTNSELLSDGAEGITFEEYDRMVKEKLDGFSPYDYPETEYYDKNTFIWSCIDTKSAIDGEKVDFGTEQFKTAIEYAKNNFEYDDKNSIPANYVYDYDSRRKGECCYAKIDDYLDFVHACLKDKGHYVIIGTPSVDATGPRFKALETISVAANTDVEDGCRKFVNYLFSGAAFENDECEFRNIVTNKDIMAKNIETLSARNNETYDEYCAAKQSGAFIPAAGVEIASGDKSATDDMRSSFLNSMSTISTYCYEDHEIAGFVMEELAPYFAGDRSIEDVVVLLNDRTTKYIREM